MVVDLGDGPVVVKDFARKSWFGRLIGRILIARETKAYGWIDSQPGIPAFLGKIDAHALSIELVEGVELNHVPDKTVYGAMLLAQLSDLVHDLHARGVVHLDLRSRTNIVVTEDRRLHVIDFGSAQRFRPGGFAHRVVFSALSGIDEMALLKYKKMLGVALTPADEKLLRRYNVLRGLWPFNRKRRGRAVAKEHSEPGSERVA